MPTRPLLAAALLIFLAPHNSYGVDENVRKRLLAPQQERDARYATPDITIIAQSCMTCHGLGGALEETPIPALTNYAAEELEERMITLRAAPQASTIMHRLLVPFSDDDIKQLARYFGQTP